MMKACYCTGRCKMPPYTCSGYAPETEWRHPFGRHPLTSPYIGMESVQQGCICPPTSEKTCESRTCPRKDQFKQAQANSEPYVRTI